VNPANQINWPQIVGSGAPSAPCVASNYGQPYTDNTAHQNYTCGSSGWFLGGGGGAVTVTSNQGVGANNAATIVPVPEVAYSTAGGNTTFACQEDHSKGIWDVRCPHGGATWASNPSQAIVNTIQAAMCYHFTTSGSAMPMVQLPQGSASVGGNISVPPGIDLEGFGATEYGTLTQLTTSDSTQVMFTQQGSMSFTCSGNNYVANTGTVTIGNMTLLGGGSAHAADIGILNNSGGGADSYIHNISFINFGGPGRDVKAGATGQGARGDHIFFASDLQWYYNSGAYNVGAFTDTTPHCALNIGDLDSSWAYISGFGQLQDGGYYNRYYLSNVCLGGGGQAGSLSHSWLQIAPHNVWMYASANGGQHVFANRFDDGWWDSLHIVGSPGSFDHNTYIGFCTSPTLNPANFPSNPGGVSTDPNCAAIELVAGGSYVGHDSIGQGGVWSSWAIYGIWVAQNTIGQVSSVVEEPGATSGTIGGWIGGDPGDTNVGADVSRSLLQTTWGNHSNLGGTIHFNGFGHVFLNDTATSNYTTFDGGFNDTYVSVELRGSNDTVTPGSGILTCSGSAITSGIHWFHYYNNVLTEMCPSGSGGGGGGSVSGLTAGYLPLAGGATSITGNSPLDYGISTASVVTSSKPVAVNDGSGQGGQFDGTEGTAPTCAAGQDMLYADSTAHAFKFCDNGGGKVLAVGIATVGASGDNVRLASNGRDIVSIGQPASSFTPTFTAGTGAGTGPTISFTSGANDDQGWINVTTGTSPAASAGVVTILYGGTYSAIRKCSVDPANGAAGILTTSGRAYIPVSTSTVSQFVITVGTTALTASTTYQWLYRCGT
jgi:hypothetical protein